MKKLQLVALGILVAFSAMSRDFSYTYMGKTIIYTVIDEEAKTCQTKDGGYYYDGKYYDLIVPNTVSGNLILPANPMDGDTKFTLVSLGRYAFADCSELISVSIPNSVTTIEYDAFRDCSGLTSVSIPQSVSMIQNSAFNGCSNLKKAEFASIEALCKIEFESEDSNPLSQSNRLFINGKEVTSVVISNSITSIGNYTFCGCSGLTSMTIPNSVTSIGERAFQNCSGLTSVSIPASVTSIRYNAFNGCSGLKKAEFASIEALCKIEFENEDSNPLSQSKRLFIGGKEVTSVVIPNSVTSIGREAFYGCSGLTSVTIPNSVTSIGGEAFYGCSGLTSVNVSWQIPIPDEYGNIFDSETYASATLDIPENTMLDYILSYWSMFENISIDGKATKLFTDNGFRYRLIDNDTHDAILINGDYGAMTEANIPERITDDSDPAHPVRYYIKGIGPKAFSECQNLKTVTFSSRSQISVIGMRAFHNCWYLTSVSMPNSVTRIGRGAFGLCSALKSVIIPNSVSYIGNSAFSYCRSLKSVVIPNSVTVLGDGVFSGCESLTSISIPNSVTSIGVYAFHGCRALSSVTIPNSVTSIDFGAFRYCSGLTSLNIGNSVTFIGNFAFDYCSGLTKVIIPPSVETIGNSAFYKASNLDTIIMGHKVKAIGENTFNGTPAKDIYITAQTPPSAPGTTFSTYSGKLWLQDPGDKSVLDAYYDAFTCFDRFDSYPMVVATSVVGSAQHVTGAPGSTIQLTARVMPENASLPYIFWRSTNPKVATVDTNGLVTIVGGNEDESCSIIAETLYADGPIYEVSVNVDSAGIDEVISDSAVDGSNTIDYDAPYEVYSINGVYLGDSLDNLMRGFYIVRQGNVVKKITL